MNGTPGHTRLRGGLRLAWAQAGSRGVVIAFAVAATVGVLCFGGCSKQAGAASVATAEGSERSAVRDPSRSEAFAKGRDGGDRRSVLPGGDIGLELVTVSTALSTQDLAVAMVPYLQETVPVPQSTLAAWQANGVRAICVPIEQVDAFAASLSITGAGQSQWLGQPVRWTEFVRAPDRPAQTVALDAERLELPAGRFRLLGRAWIEPVDPMRSGAGPTPDGRPRAALHLELVPQHQESGRRATGVDPTLRLTEPTLRTESEGLLFSSLAATMSLQPGRALVLIPERPGVDWRRIAESVSQIADQRAASEAGNDEGTQRAAGDADVPPGVGRVSRSGPGAEVPRRLPGEGERVTVRASGPSAQGLNEVGFTGTDIAGPRSAEFATVGQALLAPAPIGPVAAPTVKAGEAARPIADRRPLRTILVMIPMVPERYTLLRD